MNHHPLKCIRLVATLTLLLGVSTVETSAQNLLKRVTDRVVDRVEQRAQQKADQAVDEKVDEVIDQAGNAVTGRSNRPTAASGMGLFNLNTDSSYRFDTRLAYKIEITEKRKQRREIRYELLYSEGGSNTGIRVIEAAHTKSPDDLMVIYDGKNQCMVLLQDSADGKVSMTMPWSMDPASLQEYGDPPASGTFKAASLGAGFERIGTKAVAGFKCQGYRFKDNSTSAEIWMCEDFSPELRRIFEKTRKGNSLVNTFIPSVLPTGMLLEIRTANEKTGESMLMTFTGVANDRPLVIRMSDYPRAM